MASLMPPTPFQITMGNSQKTMVLRRSRVWRLVTVHVICMPALGRGGLRGHHKRKGWPSQGRRVTSLLLRDSECGAVGSNAQCSRFSLVAFMPRSSNFYDQGGGGGAAKRTVKHTKGSTGGSEQQNLRSLRKHPRSAGEYSGRRAGAATEQVVVPQGFVEAPPRGRVWRGITITNF